jgi:hypothetical protein
VTAEKTPAREVVTQPDAQPSAQEPVAKSTSTLDNERLIELENKIRRKRIAQLLVERRPQA